MEGQQLCRVYYMGSRDQTQVTGLTKQVSYLLSHLACPVNFFIYLFIFFKFKQACKFMFYVYHKGEHVLSFCPLFSRKREATMSRLVLVPCLLSCSMACPLKRNSWTLTSWKPLQCTRSWKPRPSSKGQYIW